MNISSERPKVSSAEEEEFLATLIHDLRNPLATIRSGLRILRHPALSPQLAEQTHETMERQLKNILLLVDGLLDVSRLRQGKVTLEKEPIELRSYTDLAIESTRVDLEARNQKIHLDLPDDPVLIDGNLTRLAQALANFLSSASKYTEDGGTISLSAKREGRDLVLSIQDGSNSESSPKANAGVGLNLAKELIELHGGLVEAFAGSAFRIRFPALSA